MVSTRDRVRAVKITSLGATKAIMIFYSFHGLVTSVGSTSSSNIQLLGSDTEEWHSLCAITAIPFSGK